MPIAAAVVPAVIGAGASIYSANQQKKAASKAQAAQDRAAEQQLQLQREQFDRVQGLQQPFIQGGYAAFDQLLGRLGVTQPQTRPQAAPNAPGAQGAPMAPSGPSAPQAAPQGGADWQAYLDANPDVKANAEQRAAAEGVDPLVIAQEHYNLYGKDENRALPMQPSQMASDPNAPPDYMNMARPEAPAAPTFQRPEAMRFQDYGQGPQFSWDPSQIANDAGYQFETAQTAANVNANSAARGKLRSGDAAKALQDRLFGVAHTYGNDYFSRAMQGYNANRSAFQDNRNYGTGLTQYQQGRADNIFADDRGFDMARYQDQRTYGDARFDAERNYATNRYDTQTGNLFNLTGIGTGAANAVAGAGSAYANNSGNVFGNQANAASQAAQDRASANAGMVGSIAGAAGNVFANWGGGARSPSAPQTLSSAWNASMGGGWQSAPTSQTWVNQPSSIRPVF